MKNPLNQILTQNLIGKEIVLIHILLFQIRIPNRKRVYEVHKKTDEFEHYVAKKRRIFDY